jgi:hypothetical protein
MSFGETRHLRERLGAIPLPRAYLAKPRLAKVGA